MTKPIRLGIMQGRLSPMIDDQIQAFPHDSWEQEFHLARDLGFELIEWVLDDHGNNPLSKRSNLAKIKSLVDQTGIDVPSVCIDAFMDTPMIPSVDSALAAGSAYDMEKSIFGGLGVFMVVLTATVHTPIRLLEFPMLKENNLHTKERRTKFLRTTGKLATPVDGADWRMVLETDLAPDVLAQLVDEIGDLPIGFNYDMGNSAYWEFDPREEFPVIGERIWNVHIKDCTPEDYSVPLGQGNVDFDLVFDLLADVGYRGDFVLQMARSDDHIADAEESRDFIQPYIDAYRKRLT